MALLVPSAIGTADSASAAAFTQTLSVGLAMLLIVAYALGMLFSLRTHRELFASAEHDEEGKAPWPMGLARATLAGVMVLVALVSEVFVESVQKAADDFGMTRHSSTSSLSRWSAACRRCRRRFRVRARTTWI